MGVGPEQNFTYIAALKPKMVFIVDIRRGNLDLHLMYKALFEMSSGPRRLRVAAVRAGSGRRASDRDSTRQTDLRRVSRARRAAMSVYNAEPEGDQRPSREEARLPAVGKRPWRHRMGLQQFSEIRTSDQLRLERTRRLRQRQPPMPT